MKTADFTYLLHHPQHMNSNQIDEVKAIIDEFPYFQSARALYLKGLKTNESFKYNQELKTTAAYTTDRSVLFDYITSEEFDQNEISDLIKQNFENLKNIELYDIEDLSVNKSVSIDQALKQKFKESEAESKAIVIEEKAEFVDNELEIPMVHIERSPEEKLEIGKPLDFEKTEMHSFAEWLKITSFKPIIRDAPEVETRSTKPSSDSRSRQIETIDKFIDSNPKIPPVGSEITSKNLAKAQMLKPESLMTETLARIYLEQKNYGKAIQAYKVLSLKYPEKSGFFADQIQAIKEIQKQNKSNS